MKYALRQLAKSPGFTFTALATLAICLAANLTIFAVVDAVLLRPLPFRDADRLVNIYYTYPKLANANNGSSINNYYERRGQIPALSSLSAISQATSVVGESGATSIENFGRVTPEFFSTLGVKLFLGRPFAEAEMTYQTDHVAIISYEYWSSHYNADPLVLGKFIRLDGIQREIIGVLPPGFSFLSFRAPVYGPLSSEEGERNIGARHSLGPIEVGRLAPGATLADAQAQLAAHDSAHAAEFPYAKIVADAGCRTVVAGLRADHVAAVRPTLLILQAGAFLLLVIGAVNLVNLLLVRASSRTKELAIRQALGASQRDVIRQAMTETVLLTSLGTIFGLGLGAISIRLLSWIGIEDLPLGASVRFDLRVAAVALLAAIAVGVAIGLPVAWFNLRHRLAVALQTETRGATAGRATQRLRHGFIVTQIAVAFVLLTGAGLLGLSLQRAMAVAPGFRMDHVITGQFTLTWAGYHTKESFPRFFDRLEEKSRGLPGATAVGVISDVPVTGVRNNNVMTIPGRASAPGESLAAHPLFSVAGDYFGAMGIPLRGGRFLNVSDEKRAERNCVVDENFARHYWPNENAVGKQILRGTPGENEADRTFTIVGVVGAVKQSTLTETKTPGAVYFPYSQLFNRNFYLVARTSLPPESLANTLVKLIREIDPEIPLTDLRSMDVRVKDSLSDRRSPALLVGIFAGTALLLATLGLYGVMAYSVSQRITEFGIRMALGAQRLDVLRLVLREGLRLVGVGLSLGIASALLLTNLISSQLFHVSPNDPLALAGVATVLALVAIFACFIPARRATKVDPMVALRAE